MKTKKIPKQVKEVQETKVHKPASDKSISFSQLSIYLSCPNRWYRAYRLNEAPYVPSIHATFGTALHETLQHWLDILYNESVKASEEFDIEGYLMDRLRKLYVANKGEEGHFSSPEELAEFYQDGVVILNYVKKNRKAFFSSKDEYLVGCEIPVLHELRPGFWFKGYIDILTYDSYLDRWKIWDIKTSTNGWSAETKKDFIKTSQVLLYKEFIAKQFNIDPDKIEVEYFIVKRKVNEDAEFPAMRRRVQEFKPSQGSRSLKKAAQQIDQFIQGALTESGEYQEREYEKIPSEKACKWCLFRDTCEACFKG